MQEVKTHEPRAAVATKGSTVTGAVFAETLRRKWKNTVYWGCGLAAMAFFVLVFVPNIEFLQAYEQIFDMFPGLYEAFTGEDPSFALTAEGFLTGEFFSWSVLAYAIYAVAAGLNVTMNDEVSGAVDVLLSLPLARWRVIVETTLAYTALLFIMAGLTIMGIWVGDLVVNVLEVSAFRVAETVLTALPPTLLVLSFTVFVATAARRRARVVQLVSLYVVGGFFVEFLARFMGETGWLNTLATLSYYRYYDPGGVIQHGWNWGNTVILLVASALLIAIAIWMYERRDLAV